MPKASQWSPLHISQFGFCYLEIIPVDDLVSTDWTMDEAMSFTISSGAIAPDELPFGAEDKQA
jgi:uncharacterized membrane protein